MMKHQRGVTLTGLLFWGIIIFLIAVLGVRVTPEVVNYYKVKKVVAATAHNAGGGKTVQEIRADYDKNAYIDHVHEVYPASALDISKNGNQVVIGFFYEKRIHLFYNVSLLLEFSGSSSGK